MDRMTGAVAAGESADTGADCMEKAPGANQDLTLCHCVVVCVPVSVWCSRDFFSHQSLVQTTGSLVLYWALQGWRTYTAVQY